MNTEFQQYRFARVEARRITRARLEAQFKDGIVDFDELEKAIAGQLGAEAAKCIPWRRSAIEQTGCRDGVYIAVLEFYWEHRRELQRAAHPRDNELPNSPRAVQLQITKPPLQ